MDKNLTNQVAQGIDFAPDEEKAAQSPNPGDDLEATPPRTKRTVRTLDLNQLQKASGEELEASARELDVPLHPARSRHQHILDIEIGRAHV